MSPAEPKGVEAVERALSILDSFDRETAELSLAELSKRTGFYKSTILRLAVSLERFGYLSRQPSGTFVLGSSLGRLGELYRKNFDLNTMIRAELEQLSRSTGETASFYVRDKAQRICLLRSEPDRSIRHSITEGTTLPLECGASGKVLLAFSPDPEEGGEAVRQTGHAHSEGERDPDVASIALPLLSGSGKLVGALALSGPVTRFTRDRQQELLCLLQASRQELESRIAE
ncbi:IclR family transcriptional regulator [Kiloniella sp. b19]|uniref:IclR family transcriptional regulator n=1 Tax=Kiloniella sp. GXU_MW_B19 TaxID=3141326 RepID=UPI0031D06870